MQHSPNLASLWRIQQVAGRFSIGSAAIAHLMPLVDHADADGPLLLEEDIATGLTYDNGSVQVSDGPGLGIQYTGLIQKT